jgi:hypothetical protein
MDNSTLAHNFTNRIKPAGKGSNMFYNNDTIYSYGYHFPIAKFVNNTVGEQIILLNIRSYSNTTSQHQHKVRSAIPNNIKIVRCIDLENNFTANYNNLIYRLNNAQNFIHKAKKAIKYKSQLINNAKHELDNYIDYVYQLNVDLTKYVDGFGKQKLANLYSEVLKDVETFENSETYKNWILLADKREANKIAKNLLKQAENIAKFRNFKIDNVYNIPFNLLRLNVEKNQIETSTGVKISVPVFVNYYEKMKNNTLVFGEKIDHYVYLSKNDIYINIGCHKIEFSEIENIINQTNFVINN